MVMKIKNLAKRKIIADNAVLCRDDFSKFMGLMFTAKQKKALVFKFKKEQNIALHMFFVFYPIDVLFLGKNKVVVDKKENFMSFTLYKSKKKALYAIELPAGTIKETKTGIGDRIKF